MPKHTEDPDKDKTQEGGPESGAENETSPEDEGKETVDKIEENVDEFAGSEAGRARPDSVDELRTIADETEAQIEKTLTGIEGGDVNFGTVKDFIEANKGKDLSDKDKRFLAQAEKIIARIKLAESSVGESVQAVSAVRFHEDNLVQLYKNSFGGDDQEATEEPAEKPVEPVEEIPTEESIVGEAGNKLAFLKERLTQVDDQEQARVLMMEVIELFDSLALGDIKGKEKDKIQEEVHNAVLAAIAKHSDIKRKNNTEAVPTTESETDNSPEAPEAEVVDFEGIKDFLDKLKGKDNPADWEKEFMSEVEGFLKSIKTQESMLGEKMNAASTVQYFKGRVLEAHEAYYGENAEKECPNCGKPSIPGTNLCDDCKIDVNTGRTIEEENKFQRDSRSEQFSEEESSASEDGEETPEGEESLESVLEEARNQYAEALRNRRKAFNFKERKFGIGNLKKKAEAEFQKIKLEYEEAVKKHHEEKLTKLGEKIAFESESGEISEELLNEYIALLEAEEQALDEISTSSEKNALIKFKEFWKRSSKKRMAAGLVLGATGLALTFTGVGAAAGAGLFGTAFAVARGSMSGVGTYMTAEAMMDTRTKTLGQKGLIDDVSAIGKKAGLNVFKRGQKNTEKIDALTERAQTSEGLEKDLEALDQNDPNYEKEKEYITKRLEVVRAQEANGVVAENAFESYDLEQLHMEITRLRVIGFEKGTSVAESGRFGKSQEKLTKLLKEAYYKKLKESIKSWKNSSENEDNSALGTLLSVLEDQNKFTQEGMEWETDSNRLKAMVRQGLAVGVGLTVGVIGGSRLVNKFAESGAESVSDVDPVSDLPEAALDAEGGDALDGDQLAEVAARKAAKEATEAEAALDVDPVSDLPEAALDAEGGDALDGDQLAEVAAKEATEAAKETTNSEIPDGIRAPEDSELPDGIRAPEDVAKNIETPTDSGETTGIPSESGADATEGAKDTEALADTAKDTEIPAVVEKLPVSGAETAIKGDSVWRMAERQLVKRLGEQDWDSLDKAKQTYLIDAIKDRVVADPAAFGIEGDVDVIGIGDKVDFTKLFEDQEFLGKIQEHAGALTPDQSANILENNDAIAKAAKAGIKISTENVDEVAREMREHGIDFISKDGAIQEWTLDGSAVTQQGGEFVVAETGQAVTPDQLENITNHGGENAKEFLQKQGEVAVDKYLSAEGGTFSNEMYATAKETGKLNDVFEKILKSGSDKDVESFIAKHFGGQDFHESKINAFLSIFSNTDDIKPDLLNHAGDVARLDEWVERFDADTAGTFSEVKEATDDGEWAPAKIKNIYALVRKTHSRSLGGLNPWKQDHYQVDFLDGKEPVLYEDDDLLKNAFTRNDWATASTEAVPTVGMDTPPTDLEIPAAAETPVEPAAEGGGDNNVELPGDSKVRGLGMPEPSAEIPVEPAAEIPVEPAAEIPVEPAVEGVKNVEINTAHGAKITFEPSSDGIPGNFKTTIDGVDRISGWGKLNQTIETNFKLKSLASKIIMNRDVMNALQEQGLGDSPEAASIARVGERFAKVLSESYGLDKEDLYENVKRIGVE